MPGQIVDVHWPCFALYPASARSLETSAQRQIRPLQGDAALVRHERPPRGGRWVTVSVGVPVRPGSKPAGQNALETMHGEGEEQPRRIRHIRRIHHIRVCCPMAVPRIVAWYPISSILGSTCTYTPGLKPLEPRSSSLVQVPILRDDAAVNAGS